MSLAICYFEGSWNVVSTEKINPWFRWNRPVSAKEIKEYSRTSESKRNQMNLVGRMQQAQKFGCESMPLTELLGKDYYRLTERYLSNISD